MSHREDWMTDAQWECAQMLADLFYGFHHINAKIKPRGDTGIEINTTKNLATFDFSSLTRMVFMAHDRCIRAEIGSSGPGMIRIILHKRTKRDGEMYERHPTLDQAIALFDKQNGGRKW